MYNNKTISVVVPCYNEETQIETVVDGLPDYIDKVVIVDDKSTDNTANIIKELESKNKNITIILHDQNKGVGAAISSGYKWSRDN